MCIRDRRHGGAVGIIGGVSGFASVPVSPLALIAGNKRLEGIFVGSRKMLEDVARLVDRARIAPVIDRVYGFDAVSYTHLDVYMRQAWAARRRRRARRRSRRNTNIPASAPRTAACRRLPPCA